MRRGYTTPTPEQFKGFLVRHKMTGAQAAHWAGLGGSNQIRKYTGGKKPRRVSYPLLFTLSAHALYSEDELAEWADDANEWHAVDPATPYTVYFALSAWASMPTEMIEIIGLEIGKSIDSSD